MLTLSPRRWAPVRSRSLEQLRLTTEQRLKNIFETFDLDGEAEVLDRSERRRFNRARKCLFKFEKSSGGGKTSFI